MKILYKYPTRDRPLKFARCINEYLSLMDKDSSYEFVVSIDEDDKKMNNEKNLKLINSIHNCNCVVGQSKTKIEAINADIPDTDWDILVLISDDMIPEINHFDNIIRQKMKENFPDTDGALWFFDGWRKDLNTLCILGRKYYDRFGYIYHPDYKSFWSDTEFTDVANILKKQVFINQVIIRHLHPDIVMQDKYSLEKFSKFLPEYTSAGSFGHDELWKKNGDLDKIDHKKYIERKEINFGIKNEKANLL